MNKFGNNIIKYKRKVPNYFSISTGERKKFLIFFLSF